MHKGIRYKVDQEGFLLSFSDWNEDWMKYVAQMNGPLIISDELLVIVRAFRGLYVLGTPTIQRVSEITGFSTAKIYQLCGGYLHIAINMAGLPNPTSSKSY